MFSTILSDVITPAVTSVSLWFSNIIDNMGALGYILGVIFIYQIMRFIIRPFLKSGSFRGSDKAKEIKDEE